LEELTKLEIVGENAKFTRSPKANLIKYKSVHEVNIEDFIDRAYKNNISEFLKIEKYKNDMYNSNIEKYEKLKCEYDERMRKLAVEAEQRAVMERQRLEAERLQMEHIMDGKDYNLMTGSEFEGFCSRLISKNGFESVNNTKLSGDFGVDILAKKDGLDYAIQCKRSANVIGYKAIQEIHTGKDYYKCDKAVVITNNYFTKSAIEAGSRLQVELWDKNKLDELIRNAG
jgi:restriction endonuclease Mrr